MASLLPTTFERSLKLEGNTVEIHEDGEVDLDDEDEEDVSETNKLDGDSKKKKKKRKNKKKTKVSTSSSSGTANKLAHSRLLGGFTDYYVQYNQTEPPCRPVGEIFADNKFPLGWD